MEKSNLREPAVAGQFYPGTSAALKKQIAGFVPQKRIIPEDVIGCMLPHAGYIYSGRVAVETAALVKIKEKVILLGPNHTGYGSAYSLMPSGAWKTPLGQVEIDVDLSDKLLKKCRYLQPDTLAHSYEHSLEVELPILQYFRPSFSFVPIALASNDMAALKNIGKSIAEVLQEAKIEDQCLLVASSDMTHYQPADQVKYKDNQAIAAIEALDEERLVQAIKRFDISMCGYMPMVVMLVAAKALNATKAKLVSYATSGDVTGDNSSVVGYAGMVIE